MEESFKNLFIYAMLEFFCIQIKVTVAYLWNMDVENVGNNGSINYRQ